MQVALALLPLLLAAPGPDDSSLEAFLRRAREARDASEARFRPRVTELLDRLSANAGARTPGVEEQVIRQIRELGPEAAPLFLPALDPGDQPLDADRYRSQVLATALAELEAGTLTDGLLDLLERGSLQGRRLAAHVLGHAPAPDRPRVARELERHFQLTGTPTQRLAYLRSLVRLGQSLPLLRSLLADAQPEVVRTTLSALVEAGDAEAAPAVMALVRTPGAVDAVLGSVTGYFLACPTALGDEGLDELVQLVERDSIDLRERVALLEAVPRLTGSLSSRIKRRLQDLSRQPNAELRDASLLVMALLGDKGAARDLLRPYDARVDQDDERPESYQNRADVYLRLGEYRDAIRDYKRALDLLEARARQRTYFELWANLARAYIKNRNLGKAYSTLDEFELNMTQKERLAADPDFAPLLEHRTYRKVFE